jgi:hypothetical protein
MLKKFGSKATASEEVRRTLRYVEPLSEARTPLTGFFSILEEAVFFEIILINHRNWFGGNLSPFL